jgi:hypothetical protein
VSKAIKAAMDDVKSGRWMHAYTYSGHPTCCAVGLANVAIMERERLWERAAALGTRLHEGLKAALGDHPHVGDIRGGKGLLAAVELVEDRGSKASLRDKRWARVSGDGQARGHDARPGRAHLLLAAAGDHEARWTAGVGHARRSRPSPASARTLRERRIMSGQGAPPARGGQDPLTRPSRLRIGRGVPNRPGTGLVVVGGERVSRTPPTRCRRPPVARQGVFMTDSR